MMICEACMGVSSLEEMNKLLGQAVWFKIGGGTGPGNGRERTRVARNRRSTAD